MFLLWSMPLSPNEGAMAVFGTKQPSRRAVLRSGAEGEADLALNVVDTRC
jgi:hypothetical protein